MAWLWSWLSGRRKASDSPTSAEIEQWRERMLKAPPSPTFGLHHRDDLLFIGDVYSISIVLYDRVNRIFDPRPELYIKTRRAAVAKYIMYEHEEPDQWPPREIQRLEATSCAHRQFCLRMRRCGALEREMHPIMTEEGDAQALEAYSNHNQYLFGWPKRTEDGLQPVWVHKGHPVPDPYLDEFAACETMAQYCERLKQLGGVYYGDVECSPEAREANIVRCSGPGESYEKG